MHFRSRSTEPQPQPDAVGLPSPPGGPRRLLRWAWLPLLFAGFVGSCYHSATWHEFGEHVAQVSWLPDDASDITYYASYLNTRAEFSISERGFLSWAHGQGWSVEPIREKKEVPRPLERFSPAPEWPTVVTPENQERVEREFADWRARNWASVTDGYWASHRRANGGGYSAAYDRKAGRAYYQTNPR